MHAYNYGLVCVLFVLDLSWQEGNISNVTPWKFVACERKKVAIVNVRV